MTALISKAQTVISFAFGPFLLIPEQQLLLENEEPVPIGGRAFDLLTVLVERQGQVIGKLELIAQVWPGLVVEEGNLKVNIAAIRRILHETGGPPTYIETVPRGGYKFTGTVRRATQPTASVTSTPRKLLGVRPHSTQRIRGREEAIQAIVGELRRTRLVSVVGPGGVGKTTVALAVADRAAAEFKDGARLVDLSKLEDASQVPGSIAEAIGSRTGANADALLGHLRDREMLLFLDNCEHLIGAVAQCVDHLLANTRKVKVLTTSREPLSIRGERVRRLHGLALPPMIEGIRAEEAMQYAAVQLFADRATEPRRSFQLDDANATLVTAICHRLDGYALAIERVAQRVGAHGIAGILDHLDRRFHMFDGYHQGPARHRTLTASIDSSYSLLSSSEQLIMRRLSIFGDAFTLESACIVGGADDIDRATVVEIIAKLVSNSLLVAEQHDGDMLYRQAHVTRAFSVEKTMEHGELARTHGRHGVHSSSTAGRVSGPPVDAQSVLRDAHVFRPIAISPKRAQETRHEP